MLTTNQDLYLYPYQRMCIHIASLHVKQTFLRILEFVCFQLSQFTKYQHTEPISVLRETYFSNKDIA